MTVLVRLTLLLFGLKLLQNCLTIPGPSVSIKKASTSDRIKTAMPLLMDVIELVKIPPRSCI